jgi:HD superfamily phosphohydrolase
VKPLLDELSLNKTSPIRIPAELDVPVSARLRRLLDTPSMQRLRRISQLGLVAQVYPGATHSRFEHSLGVYRLGCLVLSHLMEIDDNFRESITPHDGAIFLLSAALHDIGHWPYCHPIEDLNIPGIPEHEQLARRLICDSEVSQLIRQDWDLEPQLIADFIAGHHQPNQVLRVLRNAMDGPIDIDKMDYLQRDSLHAGVPYGRNFDVARLISSMRLGQDGSSLAIAEKGKTAAEMLVFARYVMFSEVYWHHAVRSGTAMLQRLVYELRDAIQPQHWLELSDLDYQNDLRKTARGRGPLENLAEALFGNRRLLYKRFAEYSFGENNRIHQRLAGQPYSDLVNIARELSQRISSTVKRELSPAQVLIDAAPVHREVQFKLKVWTASEAAIQHTVALSNISPVVSALATEQFDHFVKRVRVFIDADHRNDFEIDKATIATWLHEIADDLGIE